MPRTRILLVDDDQTFARVLQFQLERNHYSCEISPGVRDALKRIGTAPAPDLILLDYCLGPREKNGLEICRQIKSTMAIPVIILTATEDVQTVVSCLDAGADQYIVKPYNLDELLARMRAVLRLYEKQGEPGRKGMILSVADISLDTMSRVLSIEGNRIQLTEMESAAAQIFVKNSGRIVERSQLYSVVYGTTHDPLNRGVDMLVARLRKKIAAISSHYSLLAIRNKGYRLQHNVNAMAKVNEQESG